ncbi:hypothetical protein CFC21_054559 [Triticum aestivum]|uniref:F-box associated beta-propeller type 3 domain-containing protein n=3 Tax=Triticum TaxID=4564 RepID=A0A9R0SNL5_TRITD|nr:F-box protein At5g18160-like [Triticum aestivum]KAF7045456.1 hypothetical protein CFC21_054559 [Triticum aestivum]VAH98480.1 unnamed protein product [Triticum turgidum subsp. durum]
MPGSSGVTAFDDLPEWLVLDEILVRLPPKDVLRCRAVRKSWRSGTSTHAFILGHRRHQPLLPIIQHKLGICRVVRGSNDLKIRPVIRYDDSFEKFHLQAACDGLLIVSQQANFFICNPATHKCAPLPCPPLRPHFNFIDIVSFYRHPTSGEHRILWVLYTIPVRIHDAFQLPDYFILAVGSSQPRCIQWPTVSIQKYLPATPSADCPPVHHRRSLHWLMGLNIIVFDTVAETFRQMSRPTQFGDMVSLLDMGGALALCHTAPDCATLDVWVLQDYDAGTWGFRFRVDLLGMEASPPVHWIFQSIPRMVLINERELLIQRHIHHLLHCDIDGVFLGNVESEERLACWTLTRHCLQESMISLPLFEMQEEEAVNQEPPFSIVL